MKQKTLSTLLICLLLLFAGCEGPKNQTKTSNKVNNELEGITWASHKQKETLLRSKVEIVAQAAKFTSIREFGYALSDIRETLSIQSNVDSIRSYALNNDIQIICGQVKGKDLLISGSSDSMSTDEMLSKVFGDYYRAAMIGFLSGKDVSKARVDNVDYIVLVFSLFNHNDKCILVKPLS